MKAADHTPDPATRQAALHAPPDGELPVAAENAMGSEEQTLWEALRARADMGAREQLLALHLPYARVVAATYYRRRTHNDIEFEEYLQLASLGMVESVDRYDATRGVQFRTFAARRMHGAILNGLERLTEKNQQIAVGKRLQQERLEAAKAQAAAGKPEGSSSDQPDELFRYLAEVGVGLALGVLLEGTGMIDDESFGNASVGASPEISYFRQTELQRLQKMVREQLQRLTQQEQTVIRYHYLQEVPFEQIAQNMNLSKGRISQIHRSALSRLKDMFTQIGSCDLSL
jgi:RNA polymerase sigma factor for flagellar operon FliA